jgi:hypothetical protein
VPGYPASCSDPSLRLAVRKLDELKFRKWVVMIAAATLMIAIIRL